ncbi:hypothetical protein [Haloarchaeobius iranensis]
MGHHMLALDAADVGQNSTLVTVADRVVPADRREPIRAAVASGSVELSADESERFRSVLGEAGFVCTAHAVVESSPTMRGDSRRHKNPRPTGNWSR